MCFVPAAREGWAHGGTRREKGLRAALWAPPEHGEREGNTAHPSGVHVPAVPRQSRGPNSQGSPRTRGVARSASPRGTAQRGARGQDRAAAAPPLASGRRGRGDSSTRRHRDTGTAAPSPERGGAPAANTRREQDGGRGRKERGTEKGSAAPRDGAGPPADGRARPLHLHRSGAWRARAPGSRSLTGEQQSPLPRGRERCSGTQTRDAALPNA